MKFANYDEAGRIRYVGDVPDSMIELQKGAIWIGTADPEKDYITGDQCKPRPAFPAALAKTIVSADATDTLVISNVPAGSELSMIGPVSLEGKVETAGDVKLTFALTGTYELTLSLFPFLNLKATIHAV